jgi:serine/threonine-protein kinase RsbW
MERSYALPCRTEALRGLREALERDLIDAGLPEAWRDRVILATDEACANAVIHGNGTDPDRQVRVAWRLEDGILDIRVADVGFFEPDPAYLERTMHEHVDAGSGGGLGLRIMHRIMDEVHYAVEDGEHVCRMRLRVQAADA